MNVDKIKNQIFEIKTQTDFDSISLELFHLHLEKNQIYKDFVIHSKQNTNPQNSKEIPFLPIELFKTQYIGLSNCITDSYFTSSGTTSNEKSKHYIYDYPLYEQSFFKGFELFFGHPSSYAILALLPNYLEQQNSSLIYMVKHLIEKSSHPQSGFYLYDHELLFETLKDLNANGQKSILFGVSFALLDFAEHYTLPLQNTSIIETGGMKGKRKEIPKEALHAILKEKFPNAKISSEYGMTELLSQAYLQANGRFAAPPWMQILIRDPNNPMQIQGEYQSGGINVIDLANIYSCPFIATQDLGRLHDNKEFEVLGRFDISDIRGCNLMVE